jgi:hypothetical protein
MDLYLSQGHLLDRQQETDALDRLLEVFDEHLDPLARHALLERETELARPADGDTGVGDIDHGL